MKRRFTKRFILPHASICKTTRKHRWPDQKAAISFLHRAATFAHWDAQDGVTVRRREIRCYHCTDCNGYHTTSQPLPVVA